MYFELIIPINNNLQGSVDSVVVHNIIHPSLKHFGEYTCVANNTRGRSSATLLVTGGLFIKT